MSSKSAPLFRRLSRRLFRHSVHRLFTQHLSQTFRQSLTGSFHPVGMAVLLLVVITANGCNHLPPPGLKTPGVSASEIQITEIGYTQIKFSLSLSTTNPNDVVLPLSNLLVDLELLGQPFANGRAKQDYFELAAGAVSVVPIEFVVPTSRVRELLRSIKSGDQDRFDYRLKGSANWGKDGVLLPFERVGELQSLKRLFDLFKR